MTVDAGPRLRNLWLVTGREIRVRGRSKSYLIGLAVSVIAVAALAIMPAASGGGSEYDVGVIGADSAELERALTAGNVEDDEDATSVSVTEFASADQAREAVLEGDADAAILDDATLLVDGSIDEELRLIIDRAYSTVTVLNQLRAEGLDSGQASQALRVAPLQQVSVDEDADDGARGGLTYVVSLVMFFMLMYPVMYVAMGVVEEKSSRIVEILLSTMRTWHLLGGKILGLGVLGFINMLVIVGAGLGVAAAVGTLPDVPDGLVGVFIAALGWWILGYAFFAALAGAAGSLVSRQEDANATLTPVTLTLVGTYLVSLVALSNPDGTVVQILSFVPPFSALLMPVRTGMTDVAVWQPLTAAALLAAAAAATLALGATVYKRSVLRMGGRIRLRQVLRTTN